MNNIILSLFDFTGNWPSYFKSNGYEVYSIDIDRNYDVLKYEPPFDHCYGILSAPPCTHLSLSGSRLWKQKDLDGRTDKAIQLIKRTLYLIELLKPTFWILENPIGRIPDLIPELGKYKLKIQPSDYAGYSPIPNQECYSKQTCLWGNFKMGPKNSLPIRRTISIKIRNQFERSITPLGFAYATYLGNRINEPSY